jgi:hypothetical protein
MKNLPRNKYQNYQLNKEALNQLSEINLLLKKNQNNQFLQKAIDLHNRYYSAVKKDLEDLVKVITKKNFTKNSDRARKLAINNMKSDLSLISEVKNYLKKTNFDDEDNRFVRFAFNKTDLILQKSIEKIIDEKFFFDVISGDFLTKINWQNITFFSQQKNQSDQYFKGGFDISIISCCLFYLLDDESLESATRSKNSLIYQEKITEILAKNPNLAKKIRSNYHLFIKKDDALAKIYEAYEFGGDKDLENFYQAKFLPLDCSTAIAKLLNIKKNQFSTYHLASYYHEYFSQGSVYWSAEDQKIKKELIKKITPKRILNLNLLKPSEIIAWRAIDKKQNINNPQGYLGKSGHIGVVLGVKNGFIYYLSWLRDLEDEEKCGVGVDIIEIKKIDQEIKNGEKIFFLFKANQT